MLIHVGEKNPLLENKLEEVLIKAGISRDETDIIWEEGKVVNVLFDVCKRERVDLLILGAMQDENMLTYYIGSTARKLSRKPPCSLLLITNPQTAQSKLKSIVVNGIDHEKTAFTIESALDFAKHFKVNELFVVEEVSSKKVKTRINDEKSLEQAFLEKERMREHENKRVNKLINRMEEFKDLEVSTKCIFGKEGYSIGHFAEVKNADLLVMNGPDRKLGFLQKLFPHNLEYILTNLPCNLMIVEENR